MSKTKISEYSSTASSNTDVQNIYIGEGMLPSDVNNAMRAIMSHLKNFQAGLSGDSLSVAGDLTVTGQATLNTTASIKIPAGTTSERNGTPATGMIRYNTTLNQYEGYDGTTWSTFGGGATGAGGDTVFNLNSLEVTTSYTLPTGKNAMSVGSITINSGASVTVPSGQRWVIL